VRLGARVKVLTPHARGLAPRWSTAGVEVETFRYAPDAAEVIGYGRSLEADEAPRLRAAAAAPLYLAAAWWAVRRQLRAGGWDWIHAHWIVPNALAVGGLAGLGGARLAIGLHGSDVFLAERRSLRPLARRVLGRASLLTGCSPELVDRVVAVGAGALPEERSRVIPYGVDGAVFHPGADDWARDWRRELGIGDDDLLLLGVGRMASKKGFQVLVEVLPELLAAHPRLHVVLAGGGDLQARLVARTAELSVHSELPARSEPRVRVHFPGSVDRDRLPALYRAADLFVLPAVHDRRGNVDGLPNVILEAMASGLPVVATSISGIPLAVRDGVHGRLVPEGDGPSLRAALSELLDDAGARARMGAAARTRAVTELTWDRVAALYAGAYREAERLGAR
jgi:glycosyltransferase involved in cell wall biosynthesis